MKTSNFSKKLSETFLNLKNQNKKAFVAYITAGDRTLKATEQYVHALIEGGVDILELGVPFSDPVADGLVIQKAMERALSNKKLDLKSILSFVASLRKKKVTVPIVLFSYFNPIFKMGVPSFCEQAYKSGVSGVLVVDLPPEEAEEFAVLMAKNNLETIFLASPTTTPQRLELINKMSTGFVYYISRTGVTGAQKSLSSTLGSEIIEVKKKIKNPMVVGFGISTAQQAKQVSRLADGIVVGSALVSLIEKSPSVQKGQKALLKIAKAISKAL